MQLHERYLDGVDAVSGQFEGSACSPMLRRASQLHRMAWRLLGRDRLAFYRYRYMKSSRQGWDTDDGIRVTGHLKQVVRRSRPQGGVAREGGEWRLVISVEGLTGEHMGVGVEDMFCTAAEALEMYSTALPAGDAGSTVVLSSLACSILRTISTLTSSHRPHYNCFTPGTIRSISR